MNIARERVASGNFFKFIVEHPVLVTVSCLALIVMAGVFLPGLVKDPRSDAFLAPDNKALVYKARIKDQFGLSDPIVVAVMDRSPAGIYNPETLALIQTISQDISQLPNINPARISSLATENNITSSEDGLVIEPFLERAPEDTETALELRSQVENMPLYVGSIVSEDGHMALVFAELNDESAADETYENAENLLERLPKPGNVELHLAGEGAIAGYLGKYIDSDASRLNPLAGLIINLMIIVAFRRINPALLSNLIIIASVVIALGVMAASGIAFYVVTNALPVILIGIAVADSIHVYSYYYQLASEKPGATVDQLVIETMSAMWRPISLTSLTTICGFLGLYVAAYMPPFKYFGLFGALGVAAAWFYSLVFLPAAMALTKPKMDRKFTGGKEGAKADLFRRFTLGIGRMTLRYSGQIILAFVLMAIVGIYAASQLVVDEDRIDLFHTSEPIYKADKLINQHMSGTNALDIVVETPEPEGLFDPGVLQQVADLQTYLESLPNVGGSVSIVDYLEQMHRSLSVNEQMKSKLPGDKETIAQYFLVYSAIGDPTDFEEEVDYDYRTAIVRVYVKSGSYQNIKIIMESLQAYIDEHFSNGEVRVTPSGRVALNYHWFKDLAASHFAGLAGALLLVLLVSALLFRSMLAGIFALVPVAASVLLVYAAMVTLGITLGIGTSMFAAVAIGLGVDFSIHTIDRFMGLYDELGDDLEAIFDEFYRTTGRALLFNFLAIVCGFGVLISSKIISLHSFGSIVVLAVTMSFFASQTLLPALIKHTRPKFITSASGNKVQRVSKNGVLSILLLACAFAIVFAVQPAQAVTDGDADETVALVNAVDDGEFVTRKLKMTLTDRNGKERVRETINYRKYYGEDSRTILFYEYPANVRGTAFLIWDYVDNSVDDDQWLYLPALRRAKRVSSADRGDYFLGTDFTYEDIKLDGKINAGDYDFSFKGSEKLDGIDTFLLEATPRTPDIKNELGYSRTMFWVNSSNWMVVKTVFWDTKGEKLKTLRAGDIRLIDGKWTRHELVVENHQTGHQTKFAFSDVDYLTPVDDNMFTRQALSRGP